MGKYWKLLAEAVGEATTYAPAAGTTSGATSPYTPTEDGTLVGLRVMEGMQVNTSVITAHQFKLTCSTFKPNSIEVGMVGRGITTAPAAQPTVIDFTVNQPVRAGVPITIEQRCISAFVNVTVELFLWGLFES